MTTVMVTETPNRTPAPWSAPYNIATTQKETTTHKHTKRMVLTTKTTNPTPHLHKMHPGGDNPRAKPTPGTPPGGEQITSKILEKQ